MCLYNVIIIIVKTINNYLFKRLDVSKYFIVDKHEQLTTTSTIFKNVLVKNELLSNDNRCFRSRIK